MIRLASTLFAAVLFTDFPAVTATETIGGQHSATATLVGNPVNCPGQRAIQAGNYTFEVYVISDVYGAFDCAWATAYFGQAGLEARLEENLMVDYACLDDSSACVNSNPCTQTLVYAPAGAISCVSSKTYLHHTLRSARLATDGKASVLDIDLDPNPLALHNVWKLTFMVNLGQGIADCACPI